MIIGMSILPLFPPPLPIFLAVLVAFLVYQYPIIGMPIGGAVLGLGLLFNISPQPPPITATQINYYFISYLGSEQIRVGFVVAIMALFIGLPIAFNRYKSVLAIDFGILAVACLSSSATYFLAIPLLFASAVYFKKTCRIIHRLLRLNCDTTSSAPVLSVYSQHHSSIMTGGTSLAQAPRFLFRYIRFSPALAHPYLNFDCSTYPQVFTKSLGN